MAKFLVRLNVEFTKLVQAETEDEAIEKAPAPPVSEGWDSASQSDYETEPQS